MIIETLKKIGLRDREAQVYVAVVKVSPAPASRIAKEARLPRQTVYSIIDDLVGEGFIEQSDRRGVKIFSANPENLLALLDRRKEEVAKNKQLVEKALPEFLSLQKRVRALPKVQYYEGEDGVKHLFENILEQYRKGGGKKFRGYGINKLKETLDEFLYDFIKKRGELGVETKLFVAQGPDDFGITSEGNRYGRKVKRIPMDPQKAAVYIVGDRVYLFSYEDDVGVMVENEKISNLLKVAFDDHWQRSK